MSSELQKRIKTSFFLFNLLEKFLIKKLDNLIKNKIKIKVIGNRKKLTKKLQKILATTERKTQNSNNLQINLALNYGSKEELINTVKIINKKHKKINEKNINDNLYTKGIPDPDIMIRTGNTKRLSNFLLWQSAYTEIFFEKKLWPDFKRNDYLKILNKFKLLQRNFGSI